MGMSGFQDQIPKSRKQRGETQSPEFTAEQCELQYRSSDIYAGVSGAHLILTGELMAIKLEHLGGGKEGVLNSEHWMTSRGFMGVYLDSPQSDEPTIFDTSKGICVLLKATVEETGTGSTHMRFLILRVVPNEIQGTYRRLGIVDLLRFRIQRTEFFQGKIGCRRSSGIPLRDSTEFALSERQCSSKSFYNFRRLVLENQDV
jgi:hypothetical protein